MQQQHLLPGHAKEIDGKGNGYSDEE